MNHWPLLIALSNCFSSYFRPSSQQTFFIWRADRLSKISADSAISRQSSCWVKSPATTCLSKSCHWKKQFWCFWTTTNRLQIEHIINMHCWQIIDLEVKVKYVVWSDQCSRTTRSTQFTLQEKKKRKPENPHFFFSVIQALSPQIHTS